MPKQEEANIFEREWLSVRYDGIKGDLPDWFPEPIKSEFALIRFKLWNAVLRNDFSYDDLRRRFDGQGVATVRSRKRGGYVVEFPPISNLRLENHGDDIGRLASWYRAAMAGRENGIQSLLGLPLGKDALRGAKTMASARKGHEMVHGSPDAKQQRWSKLQKEVDRLSHEDQTLPPADIRRKVAESMGVSDKTVFRRTTIPKKKS